MDRAPATVRAGERVFVPYLSIGAGGGPLLGKGGEPFANSQPPAAAALAALSPSAAARGARERGEELLRACVECRAADALQLIRGGDVELDCRDGVARTPLMWAASREPMEAVVLALVDAGAALDAVDNTGDTALILACSLRRAATALLLVARGADVSVVGEHGRTALDHANETVSRSRSKRASAPRGVASRRAAPRRVAQRSATPRRAMPCAQAAEETERSRPPVPPADLPSLALAHGARLAAFALLRPRTCPHLRCSARRFPRLPPLSEPAWQVKHRR